MIARDHQDLRFRILLFVIIDKWTSMKIVASDNDFTYNSLSIKGKHVQFFYREI